MLIKDNPAAATIAPAAAELLGLAPDRRPIPGHRHARIFPLSLLNADNHLDHILIYAAGGLTACSQDILRSLR
ncbi:MAG: hypothetical protein LBR07_06095 [Puniceicoccales bacterium]|nr:hypothetical protein [Puniceicoccales bacterium]